MKSLTGTVAVRALPVILFVSAAIFYVWHVEGQDAYALRNAAPMIIVVLLTLVTLYQGHGLWAGNGWRWPLGTLGFAVPALGLSLYLHYGFATDLHGMASESVYPQELFRYLPAYTIFAGAIGFVIGWIVGRNI